MSNIDSVIENVRESISLMSRTFPCHRFSAKILETDGEYNVVIVISYADGNVTKTAYSTIGSDDGTFRWKSDK